MVRKIGVKQRFEVRFASKQVEFEKYLLTIGKFYRSISKFSMLEKNLTDPQNFKNTIRQIAFKSFQDIKKNVPKCLLNQKEKLALELLAKDDSIVIERQDKGNGAVLMKKMSIRARLN